MKNMNGTKHREGCRRVFKNYDLTCERCQELANGMAPREGWQKAYFENKKRNEEIFEKSLKNHNCQNSGCGPVCTAFDW